MAFEILNEAASVVYVLGGENRYPQAEPDKVDFDILAQGIDGEGVISGCLVTERGAGQNATVDVTAGVVRIADTDVAYAGGNVNCGAANPALPRFDLIAINNAGVASAVAGVAAAPPVFPAVPANSVIVAAVWRAANDNTIANADIVDKRCLLLGDALGTAPTLIGIVGGIATPNRSHHTLSAQAGAADDLDGLAVSSIITNGEIVIIRPDAGDTITVKHNALGGADARNILCIGNADIVCDDDHDFVICIYASSIGAGSWMALQGGAAGGGNTLDAAYDQGGAGAGRIITVDSSAVELRHNADTALLATRDSGGADVADRFSISRDGGLGWGSGAGAQDISLTRRAANELLLAAGDKLCLQYIGDTAGNTRYTTAAAGAWRNRFTGATQFDDNIGHFTGPLGGFAYVLNAVSATIWVGLQFTLTYSGAIFSPRGINVALAHTGTSAFADVFGGWYQVSWRSNTNTVGRLVGLHVETRADQVTGGTWAESRVIEVFPPTYTAPVVTTLHTGIWIGDQGVAALTNVYALHILDISAGTNRYLIEAGPATPYFRVLGGFTAAGNRTPVYISEGAGPALRQLRTMDPGVGGANFAGGELVCILV